MAKTIYCLAEMMYQFCMEVDLMGGGEKWQNDFASLLKKEGYNVKLFQFSYKKTNKKWRKHNVTGLGNVVQGLNYGACMMNGLKEFYDIAEKDKVDGIFLLSMNLSHNFSKFPTLTVSHGLMIDRCEKDLSINGYNNLEALKKWIRSATHTISVDTNTIKVNAVYCPENISKMTYVQNYVDLETFKPIEKEDKSKFTVLYPRRLDVARGYRTAMESCDELLEKYNDMEFIFCGKGNKAEEDEFDEWHKNNKNKDRIKHFSLKPDEMHKSYQMSDISIIPKWYAEGTSLSCLESIACGVVPIVTCVGGLTDLVFPNVNGLMVMPKNTEQLTNAIEDLYLNRDKIDEMRNNGLNMIKAFSKEIWEKDIMNVVKKVYN